MRPRKLTTDGRSDASPGTKSFGRRKTQIVTDLNGSEGSLNNEKIYIDQSKQQADEGSPSVHSSQQEEEESFLDVNKVPTMDQMGNLNIRDYLTACTGVVYAEAEGKVLQQGIPFKDSIEQEARKRATVNGESPKIRLTRDQYRSKFGNISKNAQKLSAIKIAGYGKSTQDSVETPTYISAHDDQPGSPIASAEGSRPNTIRSGLIDLNSAEPTERPSAVTFAFGKNRRNQHPGGARAISNRRPSFQRNEMRVTSH